MSVCQVCVCVCVANKDARLDVINYKLIHWRTHTHTQSAVLCSVVLLSIFT